MKNIFPAFSVRRRENASLEFFPKLFVDLAKGKKPKTKNETQN